MPIAVSKADLETMTFSRIVVRFQDTNEIMVSGEQIRVRVLEELRRMGYAALGAESLVFGKDDADQARMMLGATATATEIECMPGFNGAKRCQLSMLWEVLDRERDRVVYRVMTRAIRDGVDPTSLGEALIWGNFYSLLARPRFVDAIKKRPAPGETFKVRASFTRCAVDERPMPASTSKILAATVLVESGNRIGTGVVISPDGMVLTAAHVVDPAETTTVRFQTGKPINATLVRQDEHHDVALLRLPLGASTECVAIGRTSPDVGGDVFAVGSPLSAQLSFSVTRGIVSGKRKMDGVELLQTDASVNRGNSGGPLIDRTGALAGIVSWKVAGAGVEGIAFGVPIAATLRVLGIGPGDVTDQRLHGEGVTAARKEEVAVDDAPDRHWREPVPPPPSPPGVTPVPAEPEKSESPRAPVESGLEIGLRTGYALPSGKSVDEPGAELSENIDGQIPLWLDAGYRLSPGVFVGAYLQYGMLRMDCGEYTCSGTDLRGGLQGHVRFRPGADFDAWFGIGVGYEKLSWKLDFDGALGGESTLEYEFKGPEWFNLQVGGDLRGPTDLSIGPFASYSVGQYTHVKTEGMRDADEDIDSIAVHHWLLLGIRGAYTL